MNQFTIHHARYAKYQIAVHCISDGSGMKTHAMRLCCALKGRWTNREKAYIMSLPKAKKFLSLYESGWDATIFKELIPPSDPWNENSTDFPLDNQPRVGA